MDLYQPCPCGSGKTFKWCCLSIYPVVERARQQHEQGQPETAMQTMAQLVNQHPGNASILAYQAELYALAGKVGDADEAIQRAFAINPDIGLGHFLRGTLRNNEGEFIGALLEFRKAAEVYDPKAGNILAEINAAIFELEMRLNRPIAARAALERAIQYAPGAEELKKAFHSVFVADSRLPESARKSYTFRPAAEKNSENWKKELPKSRQSRLSEAAAAFEKLTAFDPGDAAALFNLGIIRRLAGRKFHRDRRPASFN